MAPPRIRLKTQDGSAALGKISFTNVDPGSPSTAIPFRMLNDDSLGTVDDATEPTLGVVQVDPTTGNVVSKGLRCVDERWMEIRATGVGNDNSVLTPWTPVGRGRFLELPTLAGGEYHECEIRFSPPASSGPSPVEIKIAAEAKSRATAIELGHTESGRDGVISGVGDSSVSELLIGSAPTANVTPDFDVNLPDLVYLIQGRPRVRLAGSLTIGNTDASSSALGTGEAFWAVLSLASGGSVTITKSDKGTAPLSPDSIPETPDGEELYAVIQVLDTGIDDPEIDFRAVVDRFEVVSTVDLNITLGKGRARVDNTLLRLGVESTLSLTASSTNRIWLVPDVDGQFAVTTDATPPALRAHLLYEVTTDSSSVTGIVDLRDTIGPELVAVELEIQGSLSAGEAIAIYRGRRPGHIAGPRSLVCAIRDNGSGNSTGETRFETWSSDLAGGWTTHFTSKATDDRRPIISHDATEPVIEGYLEDGTTPILMEDVEIPPMSRIRLTTDQPEVYDGTAPTDARAVLLVEMP